MISRKIFSERISDLAPRHIDRAIAFLWFYRQNGEHGDRTAKELAQDLHDEDFAKPRVSRLHHQLAASKSTTRGGRPKSFKVDISRAKELDKKFRATIGAVPAPQSDSIIPAEMLKGTRGYLEKLVWQINGCFDAGFYDSSAVMMRRLMETLLIDIFVQNKIADEIKDASGFLQLEKIINAALDKKDFHWNRNSRKDMLSVKILGDTAAHDRTYVTQIGDIDDLKLRYRRLIQELMGFAKIG